MIQPLPQSHSPQTAHGPHHTPLTQLLPSGRLIEISSYGGSARTSLAVSLVVHAQQKGEPVAWVQTAEGTLYPPDLSHAGVDLDTLIVVRVPTRPPNVRMSSAYHCLKCTEWLLRSGAFGLVIVDLVDISARQSPLRWQGRFQTLLRKHNTQLCLITDNDVAQISAGPMVSVRINPERELLSTGAFEVRPKIIKDKIGLPALPSSENSVGPVGLDFEIASQSDHLQIEIHSENFLRAVPQ